MVNRKFRLNPGDHIFKSAGGLIGLAAIGFFGLIFGILGGALIDQLSKQLRRKNRLKTFFLRPVDISEKINAAELVILIEAAAISTAFYLCFKDPARTEVLTSMSQIYFPFAPANTTECLRDLQKPDFPGIADFFGRNASAEQKETLNRLINSAGLRPSMLRALVETPGGETSAIIEAADFLTRDKQPSSPDDYAILGVSPDATKEEIKRVYYNLAIHFHPDAGSDLTPEQRRITEDAFKKIKNAYERIK